MGQKIAREKSPSKTEQKDIIFIYDLKSTVKHFLAGTCLVNDVNNIVRYDDYELVQHKRGVEIKSLTIYKEDNKIVGYQIIYKDADKKELKLQRIAAKYAKSKNKKPHSLVLSYNEHLADIDIVYTFDCIKYIEIVTSKGQFLKAGTDIEDGYTSISKIDVNQKSYMPIVAFETTFTKDGLKEIFAYRSPIRFSKKRKRRALTVNEINSLKAAPNLESLKKAQRNLELIRNITKKSIMQLKALNQFKSLASKSESPSTNLNNPSIGILEVPKEIIKEDQYMEDQEFGIDHEQDDMDDEKPEVKPSPIRNLGKKISFASFNFINLFKKKDSARDQNSRENSPDLSAARPKALNIFSYLRFNSLKKAIGVGSPHTANGLMKNQSTGAGVVSNQPYDRRKDRSKSNLSNPLSPGLRSPGLKSPGLRSPGLKSPGLKSPLKGPALKRKATIDEALGNLDSEDEEEKEEKEAQEEIKLERQNTRRHTMQSPSTRMEDFELKFNQSNNQREQLKKIPEISKRPSEMSQKKFPSPRPSIKDREIDKTISSGSDSDSEAENNVKNFSDAIERYEIANKMSSLLNLQKNQSVNLNDMFTMDKRAIGQKRYSAAVFMKPSSKLDLKVPEKHKSKVMTSSRLDLNQSDKETQRNFDALDSDSRFIRRNHESRTHLDSAMKKILSNVADRKLDDDELEEPDTAKLPIRRSGVDSKTMILKSPTNRKETFFKK